MKFKQGPPLSGGWNRYMTEDDTTTQAALRLRKVQESSKDGNYEKCWPTYADRKDIEKLIDSVLGP